MKLTGRIVLILSLALLLLAGCGGSGGDDGSVTPAPPPPADPQAPATQAGSAADNAIDAIEISAEGGDGALKGAFAVTNSFGAGKAFGRNQTSSLTSILTERFNGTNLRSKGAILQQMSDCPAGGSVDIIENISTDTETRFMVQFNQCRNRSVNNGIEVESLLDGFADLQGLLMIDGSNGSLVLNTTFENFRVQTSIVSSGIVLDDTFFPDFSQNINVTINDFTTCGSDFTGPFSMTSNGTITARQDANGDGDFNDSGDTDSNITFTDYNTNGEATGSTAPGSTGSSCDISFTEINVDTSGGVSFTDNINPGASFALSSPLSDPLRINQRGEPGGSSYTIDGTLTVSVNEPCIDETSLTFTFLTTERIFVPDFAKCPTAGQLLVTLNDTGITVTYTESGGVEVISGDTVETFDSCDDIDACRNAI